MFKKLLKNMINIAIIISILLNIKSILIPMRNIPLPPAIDILLVRIQVMYFLIIALFIIPTSFSKSDKKRKVLIEIWFITTIMLIVKFVVDFIRTLSWR